MTPLIQQARERVKDSKLWGRTCVKAIMGGHWDNGSLIRQAVNKIEAEQMRAMKEAEHG